MYFPYLLPNCDSCLLNIVRSKFINGFPGDTNPLCDFPASISTTAFILCGKTYGNLMVDVCPTNEKLVARAVRIITTAAECDESTAKKLLDESGMHVKTALVMALMGCSRDDAAKLLARHNGHIRPAVEKR